MKYIKEYLCDKRTPSDEEIGDFVANSCIIEPPHKDKPWMCDRFTMMLPVKFIIEKQK